MLRLMLKLRLGFAEDKGMRTGLCFGLLLVGLLAYAHCF